MRVIAGKARSLRLKTIDRIKETLFNMLQPYLADCRFLDLFAGSGAIGIEALSRGAACCVFVESSPKAAGCIRDNLRFTHLDGQARVMTERSRLTAFLWIRRTGKDWSWQRWRLLKIPH